MGTTNALGKVNASGGFLSPEALSLNISCEAIAKTFYCFDI